MYGSECEPVPPAIENGKGAPGLAARVTVHLGFVLAGVVTTLLGPLLPVLIAHWKLTDAQAGLFFSAQYFAALTGSLTLSALLVWRGYRIVMGGGFALIAVGVSLLVHGNHAMGLAFTAVYGYGLGLILSSVNLWVAEVAREGRAAAALSVVNVAWGAGAIACPALIVFAQKSDLVPQVLLGIGGAAALLAIALATMHIEPHVERLEDRTPLKIGRAANKKAVILMGSFFFLYVGSESSVGGWTAALAKRMGTSHADLWALAPMFFWGGLMGGRVLAPIVLRHVKEERLLAGGLLVGALGDIALLKVTNFRGVAACGVLIGLSFAAIYPILVASLLRCFGERARRVGSVMFALASLGGAMMPWFVGFVSTHAGGLRVGLLAPLAGCIIMLSLMPLLHRRAFS
jgi:FHS family glucose/mannose:H+ symporter-like MFS transporter